ncbi:MAG: hypothetical protein ACLP9K_04295 [Nitrososphaerales archaeon]
MTRTSDKLTASVLDLIVRKAGEPLETSEVLKAVQERAKEATREKVLARLWLLMAEHKLRGKKVGSGKGCWIWWVK